jgi:hypothetical protein
MDTSIFERDTAQIGTEVNFKGYIDEVHGSNLRHVTGYIGWDICLSFQETTLNIYLLHTRYIVYRTLILVVLFYGKVNWRNMVCQQQKLDLYVTIKM